MDRYKIDSHKLIYHVTRVEEWLQGKNIYPIYLEIAPAGACNHRCTYCALDYIGYKPRYLETGLLKLRLSEMAKLRIKSIMYAGEGEPFLHKNIAEIVNHTRRVGIDVAITTNAVMFSKSLIDKTLADITWLKVSINGATEEVYSRIHRTNPADLGKVIENMTYAAQVRKKRRYKCALGMQILLLPENQHEVLRLAKLAKKIGMDYLVVKPYSQHPFSKTTRYKNIKYAKFIKIGEDLKGVNTKDFNVIFRIETMKKWDTALRNYKHCYALPFWSYIDAKGDVWGCSAYLGDERFLCGNIYEDRFRNIWLGPKRKKMLGFVEKKLNTKDCRLNCRMDEINRYLWELKNPPEHVNFI